MISRHFILFAGLLTLGGLNLNAQKIILEKHFNMNCYDDNNCYSYGYDMVVPYLLLRSDSAKDVSSMVNDSLAKIANKCYAFVTGNPAPNFKFNKTACSPKTMHPDIGSASMTYKALRNDPDFLSMYVEVEIGANEGGKGEQSLFYYFNIDFKNDQLLYIDSLFSLMNKEDVSKLFISQSDSAYKMILTSVAPEDDLRLDGINIDKKHLIAHYSTANPPDIDRLHYDVPIDLEKIRDSFNKKYSWIQ